MDDANVRSRNARKLFSFVAGELQRQVAAGADLRSLAWRFEGVAKVAHPTIDRAERLRFLESSSRAWPHSVLLMVGLGEALLDAGRHNDAEAVLERALTLEPTNQDAARLIEICRRHP